MAERLFIRMMGGFSMLRHGQPVAFPTRKAAAIVAVLALNSGRPVTRDRLAALLWPRSAKEQAHGSLRQALKQLRRILDAENGPLILAGKAGLLLRPETVTVDAIELLAAIRSGDPGALEQATALYQGDFLDGFALKEEPFEEWRRVEAEHLRRQALAAFIGLLRRRVDSSDWEAAMDLGDRLLRLEPASEEAYQALMKLHLSRGAPGAAMTEYRRCRAALLHHLGVQPSAETGVLYRQILMPRSRAVAGETNSPPVIAVLPFANLSDDSAQDYFARGFAEEVIRELTRFRSLRVIAAHSSFMEVDPHIPARDLAAYLGARYLLTGSVRRATRSIRISAELLDAATGYFLWSHRYDMAPDTLLEAHDDITRGVASTLAVQIDDARLQQATRKPLANLEAYDCWLRGLACLRRGTPETLAEARPCFERALEIDPGFARAHSGLSLTYFNEWSCTAWERWEESQSMAFTHAERGLTLDDNDPVTHFILGRVLLYRRDFERAEHHLERALELNPNDADILAQLALSDALLGRAERGIALSGQAMRLNPYHDDWYFAFAAMAHLMAGRLDEGIRLGLKAPRVATDMHAFLACALAHLGQREEAARHLTAFHRIFRQKITADRDPGPDEAVRWLVRVNPFRGDEDLQFLLDGLAQCGWPVPADLRRHR